jgi:UMF1 family MFS transporter
MLEEIDKKEKKKIQNAWAFYDWANSVYPLVITTAIFPIFYNNGVYHFIEKVTYNGISNDVKFVEFFGVKFVNTALISWVVGAYFLFLVLLLPILSGIADYSGRKKEFLRIFAYIGSISCMLLFFFDKNHLEWSMLVFALAGIGFWGSLVFYNAFLPEIADKNEQDKLSAKGFAMGYFGSSLLLVACLGYIMTRPDDASKAMAIRWTFVITGIWWFVLSHVTFRIVPENARKSVINKAILQKGFNELRNVWKEVKNSTILLRYIRAFFTYSMAVQTIMMMAVYFGMNEIEWESENAGTVGLIVSVLLIQIIAIPGAIGLSRIAAKIGNKKALMLVLVLWTFLSIGAYFIHTPMGFYVVAGFVGLVMGGTQSLSRSTYSKLLPKNTTDTSSYFSLYDITEKIGIVIGMLLYGTAMQITGSMRLAIAGLALVFVIGLILLARMPKIDSAE